MTDTFTEQELIDIENLCDSWLLEFDVPEPQFAYQAKQVARIRALRLHAIQLRGGNWK